MIETKGFVKFDDEELEDLNFNYQSNEKKDHAEIPIQTEEIKCNDTYTNMKRAKMDIEIQVEESELFDVSEESKDAVDPKELVAFLQRTVPLIFESIEENNTLRSLQNYEVKWNEKVSENKCLHVLHSKHNHIYEKDNELQVTDLSWNSTGGAVAASLGKFDHEGACQDKSFVYVWNINRKEFKPDVPTLEIETNSCIMSLLFHPVRPSLLMGGSFNGEIFLWDISKKDDNLVASSSMDEYFHREAITQMIWIEQQNALPSNSLKTQYNLISLSTDGKMLFWNMKFEDKSENLLSFPIKGYSILRKKDGFVSNVGGLCFSNSCEDKNTFIIGTEAGSILRVLVSNISLDKKQKVLFEQKSEVSKNLKWKEDTLPIMVNLNQKVIPEIKLFVEEYAKNKGIIEILPKHIFASKPDIRKIYTNPVSSIFEPHMGPVYSVNFSPFHRNLFISCSLDGSVRLYDLLQTKSIMLFENGNNYIFKALWSPTRPNVFAACSSDGELLFYDISPNSQNPIQKISPDNNGACLNFQFNKKQPDLIAIAYSNNKVKIMQLCEKLTYANKDDISILNTLVE